MAKTTRVLLSNQRIKALAKAYKVTQSRIRRLVDQFAYSGLFDIALKIWKVNEEVCT